MILQDNKITLKELRGFVNVIASVCIGEGEKVNTEHFTSILNRILMGRDGITPLHINSNDLYMRSIAIWRLGIGK